MKSLMTKGGTGMTTEQANQLTAIYNATASATSNKLWEASPRLTSSTGQTVSVDLSKYNFCFIYHSIANTSYDYAFIPVPGSVVLYPGDANTKRTVSVTSSSVSWSNAVYNGYGIPEVIWGVNLD